MCIGHKDKKPQPPIVPSVKDYPISEHPITEDENHPFVKAYRKYYKDLEQYKIDIEIWEQVKYIRLIKNAKEKFILNKFKITKR